MKRPINMPLRRSLVVMLILSGIFLTIQNAHARYEYNMRANKRNVYDFAGEDFEIIDEFIREVDFKKFKNVKLVPVKENITHQVYSKLTIYLVNAENFIEYRFPDFYANEWDLVNINDIIIQDANDDGLEDVILLMSHAKISLDWKYVNLNDPNVYEAVIQSSAVFFQTDDGFIILEQFDRNMQHWMIWEDKDRDSIFKYIENKREQITRHFEEHLSTVK